MAYTKQTWVNGAGGGTPLNADRLNHIEDGILSISNDMNQLASGYVAAGTILPYGGDQAPQGYLMCDGSEVSRTEYALLFEAIGTAYGEGDGSTTFNLPNFQGRVPVGSGELDGDSYDIAGVGGEAEHTLTLGEMPNHTHEITTYHSSSSFGTHNGLARPSGGTLEYKKSSVYLKAEGGSQSHNNMQPYIVVNYIIRHGNEIPTDIMQQMTATIPIEHGGTAANNPADARANLGITPENIGVEDYVIAEGASGDTKWRKWNSGIAECWLYLTTTSVAINWAYGSLYQGTYTWVFPFSFSSSPAVTCSQFLWGTSASWGTVVNTYTTETLLRGIDINSRSTGTTTYIAAYAIGKWK